MRNLRLYRLIPLALATGCLVWISVRSMESNGTTSFPDIFDHAEDPTLPPLDIKDPTDVLLLEFRNTPLGVASMPADHSEKPWTILLSGAVGIQPARYFAQWTQPADGVIRFTESLEVEGHARPLRSILSWKLDGPSSSFSRIHGIGPGLLTRWLGLVSTSATMSATTHCENHTEQVRPNPFASGCVGIETGKFILPENEFILFRRAQSESEIRDYWALLQGHRVDPVLLTRGNQQEAALTTLEKLAQSCLSRIEVIERKVKFSFPSSPYSIVRSTADLRKACRTVYQQITQQRDGAVAVEQTLAENLRTFDTTPLLGKASPPIFREAPPYAAVHLTTYFINHSLANLERSCAIEEKRKTRTNLSIHMKGQEANALLRGIVVAENLDLAISLTANSKESPTEGIFVDPDFWSASPDIIGTKFDSFCSHNSGVLAIQAMPLQLTPESIQGNFLIRSALNEGVFRERLQTMLEYVAGVPSCHKVDIYTTKGFVPVLTALKQQFEERVLTVRHEFQISNRKWKRLRLFPGRWRLEVGIPQEQWQPKVIETFIVSGSKQTVVVRNSQATSQAAGRETKVRP